MRNPQEAWWVALNNIDPERDTRFTMGPMDVLDHSSRAFTYGSKMGIDATRKLARGGLHARLAAGDRDGRRDEARGGRDVADARDLDAMTSAAPTPGGTREGQTFGGGSRLVDATRTS